MNDEDIAGFEEDGSSKTAFSTRDYRPTDAKALSEVFRTAVLSTGSTRYSAEQCAGWAAGADDTVAWAKRLQAAWVRVACDSAGRIAGFGAILVPGHIDLLFTAPDFSRQGVAGLILGDLLELAAAMGAKEVSVDASELSRALFERNGFTLVESGQHCRCGQNLTCHHMVRPLLIRGSDH